MFYSCKRFCEPCLQEVYDLVPGRIYTGEYEMRLTDRISISRGRFLRYDQETSKQVTTPVMEIYHSKMHVSFAVTPETYDVHRVADPEITFWNLALKLLSSNGLAELTRFGIDFAYNQGFEDGKIEIRRGFAELMIK